MSGSASLSLLTGMSAGQQACEPAVGGALQLPTQPPPAQAATVPNNSNGTVGGSTPSSGCQTTGRAPLVPAAGSHNITSDCRSGGRPQPGRGDKPPAAGGTDCSGTAARCEAGYHCQSLTSWLVFGQPKTGITMAGASRHVAWCQGLCKTWWCTGLTSMDTLCCHHRLLPDGSRDAGGMWTGRGPWGNEPRSVRAPLTSCIQRGLHSGKRPRAHMPRHCLGKTPTCTGTCACLLS